MKKIITLIALIVVCFACEDVIDIEVPNSKPRLVIEASINWLLDTPGNEQQIKLSLTAPYFDDEIPAANGAEVKIEDDQNNTFIFTEDSNTGIYKNSNFIPRVNGSYNLTVNYKDEIYKGTETLKAVPAIDSITQVDDGGITGEDIEIRAYFTDPAGIRNFYFFEFTSDSKNQPTQGVFNDEFFDGNVVPAFYIDDDIESGDELFVKGYGVSERFERFMAILLNQANDGGGGPFQTQPAVIRGNVINTTNDENFPFGYFRLSQVAEYKYTVK